LLDHHRREQGGEATVKEREEWPPGYLHWKMSSLSPERNYPEPELRAGLAQLRELLSQVPAVGKVLAEPSALPEQNGWCVTFTIDTAHPLIWDVVHRLAHAVNDEDCGKPLATLYPAWMPPEGGKWYPLWWHILPKVRHLDVLLFTEYLKKRLPRCTDPSAWRVMAVG
jgi:hypothetical protein